jgi:hypothetical protein
MQPQRPMARIVGELRQPQHQDRQAAETMTFQRKGAGLAAQTIGGSVKASTLSTRMNRRDNVPNNTEVRAKRKRTMRGTAANGIQVLASCGFRGQPG